MTTRKTAASAAKTSKPSGHQLVAEFMDNLVHPFKNEIEEVRQIILSADPQISEHIKWNAPSFRYNGDDRVTFHLRGKGYFQLIFHCGAKVKEHAGNGRMIEDDSGLLEWAANDRAIAKFTGMDDVKAKKEKLAEVIGKWIRAST